MPSATLWVFGPSSQQRNASTSANKKVGSIPTFLLAIAGAIAAPEEPG